MDGYSFWQDLFDTYQSLSDWMKVLWLIVPPVSILGLAALIMRFRIDSKQADHGFTGKLLYSIHRDEDNQFHVIAHSREEGIQPTLLLLAPANRDPQAPQN